MQAEPGSLARVLVVDPNVSARGALCAQLERFDYEAWGVPDEEQALRRYSSAFAVIILEADLPPQYGMKPVEGLGLRLASRFRQTDPAVAIILRFSTNRYQPQAEEMFQSGAGGVGYLQREAIPVPSIMPVVMAGNWVCITAQADLTRRESDETYLRGFQDTWHPFILHAADEFSQLSEDERRTLDLLGESNQTIASQLNISLPTVEARLTAIYGKLGLERMDRRWRPVLLDHARSIYDSRRRNHN